MNLDPVVIIVLSFATWRLSSLLAREEGPFDAFSRLRIRAGARYDEFSNQYGTNSISRMMLCVWCNSVWIGLFVTILYYFFPEITIVVSLPFFLSSVAVLIDYIVDD